ncbi:MAG: hypothetical protein DCF15_19515 [Phormidesmis priestleyi]|uniref:Uncharacterized protein n=1 Tax=Phormidesmis priestleyi TaxID=268141 RepID=A0A2W4WPK5_9CYAN|nr:MAG: hypothetical protein DCF15_19515 [Phormidesmis priestleyi]
MNYCRYRAHIYQVEQRQADKALIRLPGYLHAEWANVSPAQGEPILIPTLLWVKASEVQFLPGVNVQALPPIPVSEAIEVGSRCKWGTSLAEWAVLAIEGATAQIRQVSGWAEAIVFDAPITELRPLVGGKDRVNVIADVREAA